MENCNLLDKDFGKAEAIMCFVWAQGFVTDEIARRQSLVGLNFVDFLEALARIITLKPLPTPAMLSEYGAQLPSHFYLQYAAGVHRGVEALERPLNRKVEEASATPLGPQVCRWRPNRQSAAAAAAATSPLLLLLTRCWIAHRSPLGQSPFLSCRQLGLLISLQLQHLYRHSHRYSCRFALHC